MGIRSIAANPRTRLAVRFVHQLSIEDDSTHGDILKTVVDICPNLVQLKLKMKKRLFAVS